MIRPCSLAPLFFLAFSAQAQSVAWQPWSQSSFAQARTAGKLALVDAEATWCHWCHVMDEKTYGDPKIQGLLRGLLALHEATGEPALLARAEQLTAFMERNLSDGKGLFRSRTVPEGATGAFAETRTPFEDNGMAAHLWLRLHAFTGNEAFRERAKLLLAQLGSGQKLEDQGRWLGEFLLAADEALEEASHLVVAGPRDDPRTAALFKAALKSGRPNLAVILHDPASGAPKNPDLGFPPLKQPAVFLCGKATCSSPLSTPEAVLKAIR